MSDYHYRGPAADHNLLSPSGRCSKRAREAALKREHDRLFPPGYWDEPKPTQEELNAKKAKQLRRSAGDLLRLAELGTHPRKYRRVAVEWLAQADSLDGGEG